MRFPLLSLCVLVTFSLFAQSNLETELIGTWSVVDVVRIRTAADPSKVVELKSDMQNIRLDFNEDHNFQLQSSIEEANIDGTWMIKGSSVGLRSSRNNGMMTMDVQQRDGRWFFILPFAELEVRKD